MPPSCDRVLDLVEPLDAERLILQRVDVLVSQRRLGLLAITQLWAGDHLQRLWTLQVVEPENRTAGDAVEQSPQASIGQDAGELEKRIVGGDPILGVVALDLAARVIDGLARRDDPHLGTIAFELQLAQLGHP